MTSDINQTSESVADEFSRRETRAVWGIVMSFPLMIVLIALQYPFVAGIVAVTLTFCRPLWLLRCPSCTNILFFEWIYSYGLIPRICAKCGVGLRKSRPRNRKKHWWYLLLIFPVFFLSMFLAEIAGQFHFHHWLIFVTAFFGPLIIWVWYGVRKGYITRN